MSYRVLLLQLKTKGCDEWHCFLDRADLGGGHHDGEEAPDDVDLFGYRVVDQRKDCLAPLFGRRREAEQRRDTLETAHGGLHPFNHGPEHIVPAMDEKVPLEEGSEVLIEGCTANFVPSCHGVPNESGGSRVSHPVQVLLIGPG